MNPDQLKQFNEMYQWFKNMQASSSFPLDTDRAMTTRKFVKMDSPFSNSLIDVLDPNNTLRNDRTISLSGAAQDIDVLDYPFRWGQLMDGSKLFVPLYPFRE